MAKSPEEHAHLEWLGYVQPIGLVVSIPAMLEAQCYVNKVSARSTARLALQLPFSLAELCLAGAGSFLLAQFVDLPVMLRVRLAPVVRQ